MPSKEAANVTLHAKDFDCIRCKRNKKTVPSVVFVGLNDPDATRYPMCREHADEWRSEVMRLITEKYPKHGKNR